MYRWFAKLLVRRTLRKHAQGDIRAVLKMYADDVHFVFPGRSSWSADLRDKGDIERWLQRFHRVGLVFEPQEIVVGGWPWDTTVCVHFTDHARGPDGEIVYENRGVLFAKASWGKIRSYTVYEDTQKVAAFDEYLREHEPA